MPDAEAPASKPGDARAATLAATPAEINWRRQILFTKGGIIGHRIARVVVLRNSIQRRAMRNSDSRGTLLPGKQTPQFFFLAEQPHQFIIRWLRVDFRFQLHNLLRDSSIPQELKTAF